MGIDVDPVSPVSVSVSPAAVVPVVESLVESVEPAVVVVRPVVDVVIDEVDVVDVDVVADASVVSSSSLLQAIRRVALISSALNGERIMTTSAHYPRATRAYHNAARINAYGAIAAAVAGPCCDSRSANLAVPVSQRSPTVTIAAARAREAPLGARRRSTARTLQAVAGFARPRPRGRQARGSTIAARGAVRERLAIRGRRGG
jgi:hypothetical protein